MNHGGALGVRLEDGDAVVSDHAGEGLILDGGTMGRWLALSMVEALEDGEDVLLGFGRVGVERRTHLGSERHNEGIRERTPDPTEDSDAYRIRWTSDGVPYI